MILKNRINFLSLDKKKLHLCDSGSCSTSCSHGSGCSGCTSGCSQSCGDCGSSCGDGCKGGCSGCSGCSGSCSRSCSGCAGTCSSCSGTCSGGCSGCGSCSNACDGCTGCSGCTDSCSGCGGACSNNCSGTCTSNCANGCSVGCKSTCTDACNNACTSTNNINQINSLGSYLKRDEIIKSEDILKLKKAIDGEVSRRSINNANIAYSNPANVNYKVLTEHINTIMKQTNLVGWLTYTNLSSGSIAYASNFDDLVTVIKRLQLQNING